MYDKIKLFIATCFNEVFNFVALSICRLRKFASVFEIVSNTGVQTRPCFQLVFHWVSKPIHLTRIRCSGWVRAAWIINEFENLSGSFKVTGVLIKMKQSFRRKNVTPACILLFADDPCEDSTCLNGGTCMATQEEVSQFKCVCKAGFTGTRCEGTKTSKTTPGQQFFPVLVIPRDRAP